MIDIFIYIIHILFILINHSYKSFNAGFWGFGVLGFRV